MGIVAHDVGKVIGQPPTQVLSHINLQINDGEFVALTGRSGSGKSTLLYILSCLDTASEGSLEIAGQNVTKMKPRELAQFRNQQMGFVFQFHYLIAELTALENVLLPAQKFGQAKDHTSIAQSLFEQFGLADKTGRLPRQLSGGEQQRVAIIRALVMQPKFLFADEPTGSLDSANGEIVMNLIKDANTRLGTTVVLVTHEPDFAASAGRQIHLADGRVV